MDLLDLLFANVTDRFYLIPSQGGHHPITIKLANKLVSIVSFNKTVADSYLRAIRHLEVKGLPTVTKVAKERPLEDDEFDYDGEDDIEADPLVKETDVYEDLLDLSDFTILLIDSQSTEILMPEMDFLSTPRDQPRKAFENEEGTIIATIEGEEPALSIINFRKRLALLWLPTVSQIPGYQLAAPLRTIFNWLLGDSGIQLIHAAAVGDRSDGLLISGSSGSGKTVTSLACLEAGWNFLGDDFVAIGPGKDKGTISVYSLYCTARLHRDMAKKFDLPEPAVTDDKSLYFLYPKFAEQFKLEIPLSRIFMPNISKGSTSTHRLSTADVVKEIMIPTLAYLPGRERTTLKNLTHLVSNFPCHSVNINDSIDTIPETLRRLTLMSLV
ncbi:MAG: hypothetical protein SGJ27_06475 [Candidatus Melainabacteria bacterium]|nr:hypothetical protein [Candidatus Melainabacteria bacterium]